MLSELNRPIWNRYGLIATNGLVSLPLSVLEAMLDAARSEGPAPKEGEGEEKAAQSQPCADMGAHIPCSPDIPAEWPKGGPDYNRWNKDAAGFARLIQAYPGFWAYDFPLKYLRLNIDTRDGGFSLRDRDGNDIEPERVLEAIRRWAPMGKAMLAARDKGSRVAAQVDAAALGEPLNSSPQHPDKVREVVEDITSVRDWLRTMAWLDMEDIAADGGVTVAMVVQQQACEMDRRLDRALQALSVSGGGEEMCGAPSHSRSGDAAADGEAA